LAWRGGLDGWRGEACLCVSGARIGCGGLDCLGTGAGESVSHVREGGTKVESGRADRQRWARQAVGSWQHGLQIAMHRDGGWIERSAGRRASDKTL
jgi:hypothetical protein